MLRAGQDSRGSLDVLVTNAGVMEQYKPIAESDPGEWWGTWEVNVRGSFIAARYPASSMVLQLGLKDGLPGLQRTSSYLWTLAAA